MMVASAAARSATSASVASDSKASRPISEIEVFGSKATSSKPGPTYFFALRDGALAAPGDELVEELRPEQHALDRARRRRASTPPRTSASPDAPGATAAMARRIAVAVNRSFDGSLSRCTPLVSAPRTTDIAATPGALPAITCTSRGGKARIRCSRPLGASTDLAPAVEHVGAAEFLLDLELHARAVERPRPRSRTSVRAPARQRAGATRELQRLGEQARRGRASASRRSCTSTSMISASGVRRTRARVAAAARPARRDPAPAS